MIRGFEHVKKKHIKEEKGFSPVRATSKSAGYDFFSPITIKVPAHSTVIVWSNIKAYMLESEVLMLYVRSSIGIKKGLMLANGTGIIDSDYYSNENNDGNIGIPLHNYTDEPVIIERGDRIAQGIFVNYGVADYDCPASTERVGGIGSSGR